MRLKSVKKYIQLASVLLCLYIYFANANAVLVAIKDGLYLCYNVVIPSLFIFMVICNTVSCLSCCELMAVPFMPFFRLVNINNRRIASYCILAAMGGFAVGGVMMDKIRLEFDCDENTLDILSVLMTGNSPSFIVLAAGVHYLENLQLGIMIYLSIILSAFSTAFILSFIRKPSSIIATRLNLVTTNNIVVSIKSAVTAIINICGVVTVTYTMCKVISLYIHNSFILLTISSIIEVTSACELMFEYAGKNIYLLSLILSLFPVSAYLQFKSMGNNSTLSLKTLFLSKLIQIPLAQIFLKTAVNLFPLVLNVYSSSDISVLPYWNRPQVSFFFLLLALCFVIFFDNKKEVFTNAEK